MRGLDARRVLVLEPEQRRYRLRMVQPDADYALLGGEALCQYLLREDPAIMVIARGPMPFLSGNKTTVGYISPLTELPHYSFVGGRGFAELLNLGLDAIVLSGQRRANEYIVVSGRAPNLTIEWNPAAKLPTGQREAYYWLVEKELGQPEKGSIFTLGEGARIGYRSANVGVDGLYHAGRGGAGKVFGQFATALVLKGAPIDWQDWLGPQSESFWELREGEIRRRLQTHTRRLSRRDGGTVTKLYATGSGEHPTLPARNAQRVGYNLSDLGARMVLNASRVGQTGCHWCQVNCRHWHWVDAGYAPGGRDQLLDDFEPMYAIYAMLDLQPDEDSLRGRLRLLEQVDRRLILPIEQMGCDVIDVGLGLAVLFEALERKLIPLEDVPPFLHSGPYLGRVAAAARVVESLRAGDPAPALQAVGNGPQAVAERYPALQESLFTSGRGTLGNAGHANALWTFLMPVSRFFGHYVGQLYKIDRDLPLDAKDEEIQSLFEEVIREALQREYMSCLGNALSNCAFTFVIFSEDGLGLELDQNELLARTLRCYGIEARSEELKWFAESFWARSIAFKVEHGWQPPESGNYPDRVFEVLSQVLDRPERILWDLMDRLIDEWKRQAKEVMYRYGVDVPKDW